LKILEFEEQKIISFIFKRSGKKRLKKTEFYLSLSIDLKWFPPEKARNIMTYLIKKNLLIETKNFVEPNFDVNKISIPFGYKPDEFLLKINDDEKKQKKAINIAEIILNKNNKIKPREEKNIINEIETICNEKNIYPNVASLLILKEHKIKINDYIKIAEKQILNE
jgi:hypothetical protein